MMTEQSLEMNMTRLIAVFALTASLFTSSALAQQDGADLGPDREKFFAPDGQTLRSDAEIAANLASLDSDKRDRLNNLCDEKTTPRTHALNELCAWIGQHR